MFRYNPTNTTDGFIDKSPLYPLRGDRSGSGRPGAKNSRSCFLRLRSRSDFGHDLVLLSYQQAARVRRPSSFFGILTHLIKATMSDTIEGDTSRSPRFTHWCTLFVFRYVLRRNSYVVPVLVLHACRTVTRTRGFKSYIHLRPLYSSFLCRCYIRTWLADKERVIPFSLFVPHLLQYHCAGCGC